MIERALSSDADRVDVVVAWDALEPATALCNEFARLGLSARLAATRADVFECVDRFGARAVVAHRGVDRGVGIGLLRELRERHPDVRRLFVAEREDSAATCAAINEAAVCHVLLWPFTAEAVRNAGAAAALSQEPSIAPSRRRQDGFRNIIGESLAMTELLELVARVARTTSTILVTGETGTGKELIGRAIHDASPRAERAYAAINSAAIPETLLESELFGHRRGAFTGATSDSKGLFEGADTGTVFLDEVGEMPLAMQAKLLRFLQTGEVRAVGSGVARHVDVRLVAATNRSLEEEVSRGGFREDLYYRLAVIPIHVPPLRERLEDIPLLVDFFLERLAVRYERPRLTLDDSALDALIAHDWPGNIRELENVVERSVALAKGDAIGADELPMLQRPRLGSRPRANNPESLPTIERRHIIETLDHVGWNRKRATEILQISTTTLWRRLKEFGIDASAARDPRVQASFD